MDLVREQFRIAEGEKLGLKQEDIHFNGHAIELRVQAEDVWNDFLPSLGTISYVRHPGGAFVRNDTAMFAGLEVSGHYDSLLSKLIVWDRDRKGATQRMIRSLEEMRVVGVSTSIPFGLFAFRNERFNSGELSTAFVEQEFTTEIKGALLEQQIREAEPSFVAVQRHRDMKRARVRFIQ